MTAIVVADLSQTTLDGEGIFDVLMRATKVHLEGEFKLGRIKGPEYSTVYLGALESVMRTSTEFLMQRQRVALEAELMEKQILLAQKELDKATAQIALLQQQALNAVTEGEVLVAQKCKLQAEYDLTLSQTLKSASENALLNQKTITERAQTTSMGIDADSILGRQKELYKAQTDGFSRDAEQKAAKLMIDSWNVRRTTDEGTVADATNMLNDTTVGRAVTKMLAGIGA